MLRILGIDPGTATTGFGVIDYIKKDTSPIDHGVITTPAKQALAQRLATIFDEINQLIAQHKPDSMAIEQLYFAANVTTAMSVSHARGVALLAAHQHGLGVAEYTPLQVKQAITGYGRAEKRQMQKMVQSLLKLDSLPRPDDAADALAIAICHASSSTSPKP